ncbi:ATP-dependent helicase [Desulfolutivibrio sulfoxidireducens]|uniref:ATP-dependent helicase n=1 Tax=Desulfolutivibrio sulfoxidireducens TaxID=2773299 RepID=UPI00159E349C|nr:ATP-dependent helicase [Desulfolutivibrio sulfoxidireducens]QLA17289.1 AAA family ATPase [Desulfolutivibrio sulfoxidireducens]
MDFENDLNPAQYQAVTATDGPLLVIAGAGSGKTRTIVYRLARLVQMGVDPASILLLTFTRKASQEMLARASMLLGHGGETLPGVCGGTFHAFAYAVLRRHHQALGFPQGFSVIDRADAEDILGRCKDELGLAKGDKSFPKKSHVAELIGKSRNKETRVADIVARESCHLLAHADDLERLAEAYAASKAAHHLMDYDDLLFLLERLLRDQPDIRDFHRARFSHIMVDEYQDTNMVQARLIGLLAPHTGNVMAVGDDAQSIYAFRGANVENILGFPRTFPGTRIIKLEQNYRSTQPILELTNAILKGAGEKFDKTLFSTRAEGPKPELLRPFSDITQAKMAVAKVRELARTWPLHEIAVLFRAGYQSYALEVELGKAGLPFQKYGGIKFSEAAHIKDVLAYPRLVANPLDPAAWTRCLSFVPKIGPKTALRLFDATRIGDRQTLDAAGKKNPPLAELFTFLDSLRAMPPEPGPVLERVIAHHTPHLMDKYPEDYPRRLTGLEQLQQIATGYASLEALLADMTLEAPDEDQRKAREDHLILSTVHSSKGLEWSAVLILDLVDERFPSRHALARHEDLEEERRLLYVACTRARDYLGLFVPETLYNRQAGACSPVQPSLFLRELPASLCSHVRESLAGCPTPRPGSFAPYAPGRAASPEPVSSPAPPRVDPSQLGYCRHKIFGRGKIIARLDGGKCRVNFPGFGPKVILSDYLELEA